MPDQSPHHAAEGRHRCGRLAGWRGSSQPARQCSRAITWCDEGAQARPKQPTAAAHVHTCTLPCTNSLQMLCRCRTSGLEVTGVSRKPTKGSPLTGWMAWGCKNTTEEAAATSCWQQAACLSPVTPTMLQAVPPKASHNGCSASRLLHLLHTAAPTHPPPLH